MSDSLHHPLVTRLDGFLRLASPTSACTNFVRIRDVAALDDWREAGGAPVCSIILVNGVRMTAHASAEDVHRVMEGFYGR